MLPDLVSNPGPLTYVSGALPTALHGPADLPVLKGQRSFMTFIPLMQTCCCCFILCKDVPQVAQRNMSCMQSCSISISTLNVPITTAADDI